MLTHKEFDHLLSSALERRLRPTDLFLPEGVTFALEKSHRDERFLAACQDGIFFPVIIDQNHNVIDGVRRCIASLALAHGTVPCRVLGCVLPEQERLFWRCRLNPDRFPTDRIRRILNGTPVQKTWQEANNTFSRLKKAANAIKRRKRDDSYPLPIYSGGKMGFRQAEIATQMLTVWEQLHAVGPLAPAWEQITKKQREALEELLTFRLI